MRDSERDGEFKKNFKKSQNQRRKVRESERDGEFKKLKTKE